MAKNSHHLSIVNTLGIIGYLSLIVQWMWAGIIIFYHQLESGDFLINPSLGSESSSFAFPDFTIPLPVAVFLSIVVTLAVLIITTIALINAPRTIGKASAKVAHTASQKAAEFTVRHRPLNKQKRRALTFRWLVAVKSLAIVTPVLFVAVPQAKTPLDYSLVLIVAMFCAFISCIFFLLQYITARFAHVSPELIW